MVQDLNLKSRAVHLTSASVHKAATATALLMNLGAAWVRNESVSRMEGCWRRELHARRLLPPHDDQEIGRAPSSTAPRRVRNPTCSTRTCSMTVALGTVFSGLIFVDEGAHYTDALQTCRSLLDGDTCEANSMPGSGNQCRPGEVQPRIPPVPPVDKDELCYLMARGIPDQASRTLITLGFLEDVFTRLNHEALQTAVCQRLEEKFAVPF